MMERNVSRWAAVRCAHRVRAFVVQAIVQGFADNAPLHGKTAAVSQVMGSVDGPTERAVIDDYLVNVLGIERVITALRSFRLVLIPQAEAQITDDHIGGVLDLKGIIAQSDAVAGSSLASDGDVGLVEHQLFLQLNRRSNTFFVFLSHFFLDESLPCLNNPLVSELLAGAAIQLNGLPGGFREIESYSCPSIPSNHDLHAKDRLVCSETQPNSKPA